MKLVLCILLGISHIKASTVGYLYGTHLFSNVLNNSHPFVEVGDNVLVYQNSFNKVGVAVYYKYNLNGFKIRFGVTSGYKKHMEYKGEKFTSPLTIAGITPFIAPSAEFKVTKSGRLIIGMLGDSINFGLGYEF